MKSSWDHTRAHSTYHFDSTQVDAPQDVFQHLGTLAETWQQDLPAIIEHSRPATWETRGYKGEGVPPPREDLIAEEYDIERIYT